MRKLIEIERLCPACRATLEPGLTGRETEIIKRIAQGMGSKQIAVEMGISAKTVAAHRYNLMRKLGAHNVADVLRQVTLVVDAPVKHPLVYDLS
jgi:DNA-binding CsgD family transcriptional regulator